MILSAAFGMTFVKMKIRNSVRAFVLLMFYLTLVKCAENTDRYREELYLKPLKNGYLYNHFRFTYQWNETFSNTKISHYNLFPKALGQILEKHSVQELHLSLTQGLWKSDQWGYPVESAPPGAQLWTWFDENNRNIDESWSSLVNALSGLFCASLNFIDDTNTVQPELSFRPNGVSDATASDSKFLRFATLPKEIVCTENLTPWKKLLPCDSKAGLSSLFNAIKLYNTHYHSLGVHLRPVCQSFPSCSSLAMELTQTLSVVFRPSIQGSSKSSWSLRSLFEKPIRGSCPLASESHAYVDLTNESISDLYELIPAPSEVKTFLVGQETRKVAVYDLHEQAKGSSLNIAMKWRTTESYSETEKPLVYAHRFITGYGQEKGGIACMIYNTHPNQPIRIIYMDLVPWYIRLYLHTLQISSDDGQIEPEILNFTPGRDRSRPYLLEMVLTLPASSVTTVRVQFDRAFLKWTEHPPDPNIGFHVGSAVLSVMLPSVSNHTLLSPLQSSLFASFRNTSAAESFIRIYTEPLLVQLPLPDFSMPYNVICLVCTVVAIGFGSIHNLTTRRMDFVENDAKSKGGIRGLLRKLKGFVRRTKESSEKESDEKTTSQNDENKESKTDKKKD